MSEKADYFKEAVSHIDISLYNVVPLVQAMRHAASTARDLARAADLYDEMLCDHKSSIILYLGGPLNSVGLRRVFADMIQFNMVDAIVDAGADLVGQDFFEALGFSYFIPPNEPRLEVDDRSLEALQIGRHHDTLVDNQQRQACDETIGKIAAETAPGCSSRKLIRQMAKHLDQLESKPRDSILYLAEAKGVPIFCPGLGKQHGIEIDPEKDFEELVRLKSNPEVVGLVAVGDPPEGFIQQLAAAAVALEISLPACRYAVGIKTAEPCGSAGWTPDAPANMQCVSSPTHLAVPLVVGYAYHLAHWLGRTERNYNRLLDGEPETDDDQSAG